MTDFVPGGELLYLIETYCKLPEELVRLYVAEISLILGKERDNFNFIINFLQFIYTQFSRILQ